MPLWWLQSILGARCFGPIFTYFLEKFHAYWHNEESCFAVCIDILCVENIASYILSLVFYFIRQTFYFYGNSCLVSDIQITNLSAAELLMPYEVFRKNFFAHMNELEITPGKVRLDEAIRLIVCQMSDFLVPYVISIN